MDEERLWGLVVNFELGEPLIPIWKTGFLENAKQHRYKYCTMVKPLPQSALFLKFMLLLDLEKPKN